MKMTRDLFNRRTFDKCVTLQYIGRESMWKDFDECFKVVQLSYTRSFTLNDCFTIKI